MISAYTKYKCNFNVIAIADNYATCSSYMGIPVIFPKNIPLYDYDEIWICTVYYKQIQTQLVDELKIDSSKIQYIEYPMPFLEERIRTKYNKEISGNNICADDEKLEVINYLSCNPARMYCYSFYDQCMKNKENIYYDNIENLYYGIYESKKIYLSEEYDSFEKASSYFTFVCLEQHIASPHRYISANFNIESGEVGIDIGAAEGIFALQIIDKVEHVYLIESDENWINALHITFKPFKDKITFIKAFISDKSINNAFRLDDLFFNKKIDFIKMDIEGEEFNALKGANSIIQKNSPKLAICTYHYEDEYKEIKQFLEENNYKCNHSKGFLLCQGDWELEKDETDFRRALLFAKPISAR